MNLETLNDAIHAVGAEIQCSYSAPVDWTAHSEEHLLHEAAICIFGSQMIFELAVAAARQVGRAGVFKRVVRGNLGTELESEIQSILSIPVEYEVEGVRRLGRPRFNRRLANMLASSIANIYGEGTSIKKLLKGADSNLAARRTMIDHMFGFGPKQSSLFLRRVGYCADLAVLDVHITDYLRLRGQCFSSRNSLSKLSFYECVESDFKNIAKEFGFSVGALDLAMWITMRVAKRESVTWQS